MGGFDERIGLNQLVRQFSAASTGSPDFADGALAQLYVRAKAALAAGQQVGNADLAALRALANPPPDSGAAVDAQTKKQVSLSGVMEPPVFGILEPAATRLKGTIEGFKLERFWPRWQGAGG